MKKSISIWSFYGSGDLESQLLLAKEAGFMGFEIDLSDNGPVNLKSTESDLTHIRRLCEKVGITLSGLASGLFWGSNPVSVDEEVRNRAAAILKRELECAHALGVDTILVVPGAVGVDFIPGCEVVPYDVAYERAQAFVRGALPLAEKLGVTIGIENVWNKFLLSPLEMRTFIDSFDSEFVGAYFDVGNVVATGYPEQWIELLGSRIKRVHFKDYRRNIGGSDGFVEILSGDVNWPEVMGALKRTGYDGWCTAEMIPPVPFYKFAPDVLVHNTARAMEAVFVL